MSQTAEELINGWQNGDLSIDNADTINDVDGFNIEAKFECAEGHVILTYSLREDMSYRPDPDNGDMEQFNIIEVTSGDTQ